MNIRFKGAAAVNSRQAVRRVELQAETGFTLVEMAIVIAIAGVLLLAVFKGESLLQEGRVQDALSIASNLSAASRAFKQKYHYLPGDFPVDATAPEISGVGTCIKGQANAGNGNGIIEASESGCVVVHLFNAGFSTGGAGAIKSYWGSVQVIANANSQTSLGPNPVPATVLNVVEFANLPCDVAMEIDRKIDDGNLATGNSRASVASCAPGGANDPVPFFAVPL